MYGFGILIMLGPCLMTAIAAIALFCAWRSLSRIPHVLTWALAFAVMALAVFVRGLWVLFDGSMPPMLNTIVQLCGTATALLLAKGFADRAARSGTLRIVVAIWSGIAAILLLLTAADVPQPIVTAVAAMVQGTALIVSSTRIVRDRKPDIAEMLTICVLLAVAGARLARAALSLLHGFGAGGDPAADIHAWAPAIMVEPAAVGLVAMFLIASDLSVELKRIVWTDPLTGVMNRAGFEDAAIRAIGEARPPDRPLALAIADIDRFKAINDTHGHAAGDAALTAFAGAVASALGRNGIVGRIGGEEFAMLLPAQDAAGALAHVEPIRAMTEGLTIERPGDRQGDLQGDMRMTASFGVAELASGEALASLLARADAALYRSKASGRNRCSLAEAAPAAQTAR